MRFAAKSSEPSRLTRGFTVLAGLFFVLLITCEVSLSAATGKQIKVISIDESINPGTAAFLARGAQEAEQDEAELLVVQLDTPGGLVSSMRTMLERFHRQVQLAGLR